MNLRPRAHRGLALVSFIGLALIPQEPTTMLRGVVVHALSGSRIGEARVTVWGYDLGGRQVSEAKSAVTSAEGEFRLAVDSRSVYARFSATKPGFFQGNLAPLDYVGKTYDLTVDLSGSQAVLRMWPAATVEGDVRRRDGSAVVDATVEVVSRVHTGLGPRWVKRGGVRARTDSRGTYKVDNLRPGHYMLLFRLPGSPESEAPWLLPGTRVTQEALAVNLVPGQRLPANVTIPDQYPGAIRGVLTGGPNDLRDVPVQLAAIDPDGHAVSYSSAVARASEDGRFRFEGVAPGRYEVTVVRFPVAPRGALFVGGDATALRSPAGQPGPAPLPATPAEPTWWATAQVAVSSINDPLDITIPLRPGARIHGRVLFDKSAPEPQRLSNVPVVVRPADGTDFGMIPLTRLEADGTFASIGLPPGNYIVDFLANFGFPGWRSVSVRLNNQEHLGGPIAVTESDVTGLELVMSTRVAEVSGRVIDGLGRPALDASVIIFPQDRRLWTNFLVPPAPQRIVRVPVFPGGIFAAQLPPGDYMAVASLGYMDAWMTEEHLRSIVSRAQKVTLNLGHASQVVLQAR